MLMCWEPNPECRPSFQDIPTLIDNRMDPISDYMEMDMILQPCSKRKIRVRVGVRVPHYSSVDIIGPQRACTIKL